MITVITLILWLAASPLPQMPAAPPTAFVTHTYEARIRLDGKISTTRIQASDAWQAKKLVQAQFPTATALSVKRLD
jgi:hypothetical protein